MFDMAMHAFFAAYRANKPHSRPKLARRRQGDVKHGRARPLHPPPEVQLLAMRNVMLSIVLSAALAAPAAAASYPVSGQWGQSTGATQGSIDCAGKRVIGFNGNQRTDSGGGVPAYRNRSVTADGPSQYRIVDEFSNGMVNDGFSNYTLRQVDADHIELHPEKGASLKLQRCK
jgi:hypothetical protein